VRRRLVLAIPALSALAAAGCGAGPTIDQARPVGHRVVSLEVGSGIDVRLVRGRTGATVRAGRDVIDRVVTETRGDVLHVHVRDRGIVIGHDPLSDVSVRVAMPRLRDVRVDGSADVDLAEMHAHSLTFHVRGTGDLRARGHVDRLVADIRGAADARLADLRARTARVMVAGAGDVDVNVRDRLAVVVRGAGDVTYRGDPEVSRDVSGAGDIRRAPD
jgi:Putative auto-transporter adhesin, head GIN domain